jgi:hypothetical protein
MDFVHVEQLIAGGRWVCAYVALRDALAEDPRDRFARELVGRLSAVLDARCRDLGMNKAAECTVECNELDALAQLVRELQRPGAAG